MFKNHLINVEQYQLLINASYEQVIEKTKDWISEENKRSDLSVKWTDDGVFYVEQEPLMSRFFIRHFEKGLAYLSGRLEVQNGSCVLNVKVRPNSIFSILGIVFTIGSLVLLMVSSMNNFAWEEVKGALIFLLVGTAHYAIGYFLRDRLKKRFESSLSEFINYTIIE